MRFMGGGSPEALKCILIRWVISFRKWMFIGSLLIAKLQVVFLTTLEAFTNRLPISNNKNI